MSCDDTIWMADGLPGIVIGIHGDIISVLWSNRHVSKVNRKNIVWYEKFQ